MRRLAHFCASLMLALATSALAQSYQVNYQSSVDRPGGDYRNFDLKAADPSLCGAACLMEPQCQAFTYVNPGLQGPAARCWLKSAVSNPVANPCCISGVRTLQTPPPPSPGDVTAGDLDNPA